MQNHLKSAKHLAAVKKASGGSKKGKMEHIAVSLMKGSIDRFSQLLIVNFC